MSTLLEREKEKNKLCREKLGKNGNNRSNDGLYQSTGKEDRIKAYQGKEITVLDFAPDLKYLD